MTAETIANHKKLWEGIVTFLTTMPSDIEFPTEDLSPLDAKLTVFQKLFGKLQVKHKCFCCDEAWECSERGSLTCRCPLNRGGDCTLYDAYLGSETYDEALEYATLIRDIFEKPVEDKTA